MMTRKHFEAIARTMREEIETYRESGDAYAVKVATHTARSLAYLCAESNPRFNRDRFLTACGVDAS